MNLPHRVTILTRSPKQRLAFNAGTAAFTVGEVVTGTTSRAAGTVLVLDLASGSWAAGTAAGTLTLYSVTGTFAEDESLSSTIGAATAGGPQVPIKGKLGSPDYHWSPGTKPVRASFYEKSLYPAIVTPAGETVRKIRMVMLPVPASPHEQRIRTIDVGYEGTYEIAAAATRKGGNGKPHHYEYELAGVTDS
jgi:hypothetical protein